MSLKFLFPGATTTVLTALEVFPLLLDVLVALELNVALGILVSVGDIIGNQVGKHQRIDAFALIFGLDCDEQQVNDVGLAADGLPEMPPTRRLPARFMRQRVVRRITL